MKFLKNIIACFLILGVIVGISYGCSSKAKTKINDFKDKIVDVLDEDKEQNNETSETTPIENTNPE